MIGRQPEVDKGSDAQPSTLFVPLALRPSPLSTPSQPEILASLPHLALIRPLPHQVPAAPGQKSTFGLDRLSSRSNDLGDRSIRGPFSKAPPPVKVDAKDSGRRAVAVEGFMPLHLINKNVPDVSREVKLSMTTVARKHRRSRKKAKTAHNRTGLDGNNATSEAAPGADEYDELASDKELEDAQVSQMMLGKGSETETNPDVDAMQGIEYSEVAKENTNLIGIAEKNVPSPAPSRSINQKAFSSLPSKVHAVDTRATPDSASPSSRTASPAASTSKLPQKSRSVKIRVSSLAIGQTKLTRTLTKWNKSLGFDPTGLALAQSPGDPKSSSTHSNSPSTPSGAVLVGSVESSVIDRYEPQKFRCTSEMYKHAPRCAGCLDKGHRSSPGTDCSYKQRRLFPLDKEGGILVDSPLKPSSAANSGPDDVPIFPPQYDQEFTMEHARILKSALAQALLPILKQELEHATNLNAKRERLDLEMRSTCDGCLRFILSGYWLCKGCGKDYCIECRATCVSEIGSNKVDPGSTRRNECSATTGHSPLNFQPVIQMDHEELARIVEKMEKLPRHMMPTITLDETTLKRYYAPAASKQHLSYLQIPLEDIDPQPSVLMPESSGDLATRVEKACTLFNSLWSKGEPIVVSIYASDRVKMPWTPSQFMKDYGSDSCQMVNNVDQSETPASVGSFFARFLTKRSDGTSYKIKDWPSEKEFKDSCPELFQDFMNAIPVGAVTRRDGVMNIAAHAATNSNPPDLGPKGYFSQVSDPEGSGTTKLHMDIADAVNVMMWSSDDENDDPGVAVWDIFRAEDSDKIRQFLHSVQAKDQHRRVDEIISVSDDPIHSQENYLTTELLRRLHDNHGVKSIRILQKPGDAIFLPVGCAHQVCNLSDSIKIATDFVSIQNISRCQQVANEFSQQTKKRALWFEMRDVLQLNSALLFCWKSCERLDALPLD